MELLKFLSGTVEIFVRSKRTRHYQKFEHWEKKWIKTSTFRLSHIHFPAELNLTDSEGGREGLGVQAGRHCTSPPSPRAWGSRCLPHWGQNLPQNFSDLLVPSAPECLGRVFRDFGYMEARSGPWSDCPGRHPRPGGRQGIK